MSSSQADPASATLSTADDPLAPSQPDPAEPTTTAGSRTAAGSAHPDNVAARNPQQPAARVSGSSSQSQSSAPATAAATDQINVPRPVAQGPVQPVRVDWNELQRRRKKLADLDSERTALIHVRSLLADQLHRLQVEEHVLKQMAVASSKSADPLQAAAYAAAASAVPLSDANQHLPSFAFSLSEQRPSSSAAAEQRDREVAAANRAAAAANRAAAAASDPSADGVGRGLPTAGQRLPEADDNDDEDDVEDEDDMDVDEDDIDDDDDDDVGAGYGSRGPSLSRRRRSRRRRAGGMGDYDDDDDDDDDTLGSGYYDRRT